MSSLLFVLFILPLVRSQEYYCDSDRFPLVTDLTPNDCDNGKNIYYDEAAVYDCFPACTQRVTRPCSELNPCPPGYTCPSVGGTCQVNLASCYRYYVTGNNIYARAKWKPDCLPDETWAPKQCKGETANGRCFCFDAEGNRIFGDAFSYAAEDMTCACSRRRAELEKLSNNVFVSLHCDSMGNYDPLQCDMDTEQCWCVEPKTGDVTATIVPMGLMVKLPCYNATIVGSQYLRQCESQLYAQRKITDEFLAHGTLRTNFQPLLCRYDGSYGPYRISTGIAYCVWDDNTNIGSFQTPLSSSISGVNCNCARDQRVFALAGLSHTLMCQANGNYQPLQFDGTHYYCVDDDGFIKSELEEEEFECTGFA